MLSSIVDSQLSVENTEMNRRGTELAGETEMTSTLLERLRKSQKSEAEKSEQSEIQPKVAHIGIETDKVDKQLLRVFEKCGVTLQNNEANN